MFPLDSIEKLCKKNIRKKKYAAMKHGLKTR